MHAELKDERGLASKSFPRSSRLRKKEEIRHIFRTGETLSVGSLVFRWRLASGGESKFLASASKKYGNAPRRNRFKRISKEIWRKSTVRTREGLRLAIQIKSPWDEDSVMDALLKGLAEIEKRTQNSLQVAG